MIFNGSTPATKDRTLTLPAELEERIATLEAAMAHHAELLEHLAEVNP